MDKKTFLEKLSKELLKLPKAEREERLAFYSEMIDDRIEEGLAEEAAVASVSDQETLLTDAPEEKAPEKKKWKTWEIVLLAAGSPVWASLLIAAAAVVLSLYISVWAVLISLWAVFVSLAASGVGCVAGGIILICTGEVVSGIAVIGAGLVCAGLSIGTYFGCLWLTKLTLRLTKKVVLWAKRKLRKKENAQCVRV